MKSYSTIFIIFVAVFFTLGIGKADANHTHSSDYYYNDDYYGQNTYFGPALEYSYQSSYNYRPYNDYYGSNYDYYDYSYDSYDYDRYNSRINRDYYGRNTVYGDPYASYRPSRSDRYLNRPYGENIVFDTFGAYRLSRY